MGGQASAARSCDCAQADAAFSSDCAGGASRSGNDLARPVAGLEDTESDDEGVAANADTESDDDEVDSGSEMDEDDAPESLDLEGEEEDIVKKALEQVEQIELGGAKFYFEKERFFRKHIIQWRSKKDKRSGRFRDHLKFSEVKESVGGGRTQTGKVRCAGSVA
jgi:hypothetical protein